MPSQSQKEGLPSPLSGAQSAHMAPQASRGERASASCRTGMQKLKVPSNYGSIAVAKQAQQSPWEKTSRGRKGSQNGRGGSGVAYLLNNRVSDLSGDVVDMLASPARTRRAPPDTQG